MENSVKVSNDENKIINALKKNTGRANQKTISSFTKLSQYKLAKLLISLSYKGLIVKDESQKPHIFWILQDYADEK